MAEQMCIPSRSSARLVTKAVTLAAVTTEVPPAAVVVAERLVAV